MPAPWTTSRLWPIFCQAEGLWFHVDGAFGALCALSPRLKPLVRGIERAASVAFDFHKWAHVPYDAGFLLVRDAEAHRRTYYNPTTYLHRMPSGSARAKYGRAISVSTCRAVSARSRHGSPSRLRRGKDRRVHQRTCDLAKYLEERLKQTTTFTLCAPVTLNIVCFALSRPDADELTKRIVIDLQERGVAAPSSTLLGGKAVIRAAIVNHRTTEADMDAFLDALEESARRVMSAA